MSSPHRGARVNASSNSPVGRGLYHIPTSSKKVSLPEINAVRPRVTFDFIRLKLSSVHLASFLPTH
jgi:hypothetical protein